MLAVTMGTGANGSNVLAPKETSRSLRSSSSGREARRLWPCLAIALSMHAACLMYPRAPTVSGFSSHLKLLPLELRLLSAATPAPTASMTSAPREPVYAVSESPHDTSDVAQEAKPTPKTPESVTKPSAASATEITGSTSPSKPTANVMAVAPIGIQAEPNISGQYLADEALDESPRLQTQAAPLIQYPDDNLPEGQGQTTSVLLINAQGSVDAVLVSAEQLPRRFARAIQKAFETQSFQPGRMGGREQAARLCLAVEFREGERPRWEIRPGPAGRTGRLVTPENALASCAP